MFTRGVNIFQEGRQQVRHLNLGIAADHRHQGQFRVGLGEILDWVRGKGLGVLGMTRLQIFRKRSKRLFNQNIYNLFCHATHEGAVTLKVEGCCVWERG